MLGKIHSIESLGLKDGPGIRSVVFFQGCALRCAYCHNPDTWDLHSGISIEPERLFQKIHRFKAYFDSSGGGVTCSGGEPLLQPEFLTEFLTLCQRNGIHTSLDTSGYGMGDYEKILSLVDLVILDLKAETNAAFHTLTCGDARISEDFMAAVRKQDKRLWLRHVVVPGLNDGKDMLNAIKKIASTFKRVEKLEFLPYHTLGVHKYEGLKIPYRLPALVKTADNSFIAGSF